MKTLFASLMTLISLSSAASASVCLSQNKSSEAPKVICLKAVEEDQNTLVLEVSLDNSAQYIGIGKM